MIIDCISDLHGYYPKLEGGDLLIVAGDLTSDDSAEAWCKFETWITDLNYHMKIVIGGNHDNFLQSAPAHNMWKYWDKVDTRLHYLCDSGTEFSYRIDGLPEEDEGFLPGGCRNLKIWGSPWTKTFSGMNPKCKAFTVDTEEELAEKWTLIPDDVDILVTHSPPKDILDGCAEEGRHVGSVALENVIRRIQPKIHIFGHIHECGRRGICIKHEPRIQLSPEIGGIMRLFDSQETYCFNVSHVNEHYKPVNKSIRIEL